MKNEQARPGKRPMRQLNAAEKVVAINRVHSGESKASVARDLGVPESTLRGWCKSEQKILSMAHNSSPENSEAHSPGSSSGANANGSNMSPNSDRHSNEEDIPTTSKKPRTDHSIGLHRRSPVAGTSVMGSDNHNSDSNGTSDQNRTTPVNTTMDYMNLLATMNSMQKDNSSMLLQHLFNNGSMLAARNLANAQGAAAVLPTVGLVENGLQYAARGITTTSNGYSATNSYSTSNSRRHTISSTHTDVGSSRSSTSRRSHEPTQQSSTARRAAATLDASCTTTSAALQLLQRQYLHQQHQHQLHQQFQRQVLPNTPVTSTTTTSNNNIGSRSSKRNSSGQVVNNGYGTSAATSTTTSNTSSGTVTAENHELMMQWLTQYGNYFNQQSSAMNPRGIPLFWEWCKYYYNNNNNNTATATNNHLCSNLTSSVNLANGGYAVTSQDDTAQSFDKKSPEEVKANLDRFLCSNVNNDRHYGNENGAERLSSSDEPETAETEEEALVRAQREREHSKRAIEHGEQFVSWLAECSDPNVSLSLVRQIKELLQKLRNTKLKTEREREHQREKDLLVQQQQQALQQQVLQTQQQPEQQPEQPEQPEQGQDLTVAKDTDVEKDKGAEATV